MKKSWFVVLAVAGAMAISAAGATASVEFTPCHAPGKVGGVYVFSLKVKGIGCEAAAENTRRFITHHKSPEAFTCLEQHRGTRDVEWSCHRGDKSFYALWRAE